MELFDYIKQLHKLWEDEVNLNPYLLNKYEHCKRVANYLVKVTGDDEQYFYGLVHDIGRIKQYMDIGKFNDIEYNHGIAGVDLIEGDSRYSIFNFRKAREAILYHSEYNISDDLEDKQLLDLLTAVDQFDNAITCKDYLQYEYDTNAKGYSYDKHLTDKAFESLVSCNWHFAKNDCITYADYFYFAYTLLLRSLDRPEIVCLYEDHEDVLKEIIKTFEFFRDLFSKHVDDQYQLALLNSDSRLL